MEHIEGETLEARLARGPLPLAASLEYSIQIADALDEAHRAWRGAPGHEALERHADEVRA